MGILKCGDLRESVVIWVNLGIGKEKLFEYLDDRHVIPMRCDFYLALDMGKTTTEPSKVSMYKIGGGGVDVYIEALSKRPSEILHIGTAKMPYTNRDDAICIKVSVQSKIHTDSTGTIGSLDDMILMGLAYLICFTEPGPVEGYVLRTEAIYFEDILCDIESAALNIPHNAAESTGDGLSDDADDTVGSVTPVEDDDRVGKPGPIEAAMVELGRREDEEADAVLQSPNTSGTSGKFPELHIRHNSGTSGMGND